MKEAVTEYKINDLIKKRWSPRAFENKSVEEDKLYSLFEAARWTPSSMNEQPWNFIAVRRENFTEFNKVVDSLSAGNQKWAKNAPVLIICYAKRDFSGDYGQNKWAAYDTGQSIAYLTLQAGELGLYLHQMGGFSPEKIKMNFGISDEYDIMPVIALGYLGKPDQLDETLQKREEAPRKRKNLYEIFKIL